MRILDILLKDLSQIYRDRKSLLFIIAMPVVFTFFMGLAYGGMAAAPDPRLPLGWVNNDPEGLLSGQLYNSISAAGNLRLVDVSQAEAERQVSLGDLAGALVVPADFSSLALAGKPVQFTLVADPVSVRGQSASQLLRTPVMQVMSSLATANLAVDAIAARKPFADAKTSQSELQTAFQASSQAWGQSQTASLVKVEQAVVETAKPFGGNPYNQSSPGILVMFAVFGLVSSAQILVQERKTRTLQRMMTTDIRPWQVIAGHLLAMFVNVLLQSLLLIVFGQLVLQVNYFAQPLGILLVAVALGLWVSAMGLLIGTLARNDDQVVLFTMLAMFAFSALGGTWFALDGAGKVFATIGHLTPAAWAMDGFQNILIRGQGLESALLPAGILLAYALLFFGIAVWRFRVE